MFSYAGLLDAELLPELLPELLVAGFLYAEGADLVTVLLLAGFVVLPLLDSDELPFTFVADVLFMVVAPLLIADVPLVDPDVELPVEMVLRLTVLLTLEPPLTELLPVTLLEPV